MWASSAAWSALATTPLGSEMNDAGVGTGGTYFVIAPPVGVRCGSAIRKRRAT
jgi:hypothetical protein